MKYGLLVAIVSFFVSLLLGLFSGVSLADVLYRSVISSAVVLFMGIVFVYVVQKFLPGFFSLEEFSDLSQRAHSSDEKVVIPEVQKDKAEVGGKINVVLGDGDVSPVRELNQKDSLARVGIGDDALNVQSIPRKEMTKKTDAFLKTDPDVLARMVRARLRDED